MTDNTIDCVIIGGGPSGLSAAYRLHEAGVNVRVLEMDQQVGGRMQGGRWQDNLWYDQGAQFICDVNSPFGTITHDLGKPTYPFLFADAPTVVFDGSEVRIKDTIEDYQQLGELYGWPQEAIDDYSALRARFAEMCAVLDGDDKEASARLHAELDGQAFPDVIGDVHPEARAAVEGVVHQECSHDPKLVSAVQGVATAHYADTIDFNYAQFGTNSIWTEIAVRLGDAITLNAEVTRVSDTDDGVEVDYRVNGTDQTVSAKYAVVATRADQVAGIVDRLPEEKKVGLEKCTYGSFVSVVFLTNEITEQRWDKWAAISNFAGDAFELLVHQSFIPRKSETARGKGSVFFALCYEREAERLIGMTEDEISAEISAAFYRILPEVEDHVEKILVRKWTHGIPAMTVGGHGRCAALRAPFGRIHFCGDYLALGIPEEGPGVETAEAAAAAIVASLAKSDREHS
ncbi:MAG: FAD-dependent oxidoreductase [Rhodococcus sp. (in: high G+C Gram-positive bacteria)]